MIKLFFKTLWKVGKHEIKCSKTHLQNNFSKPWKPTNFFLFRYTCSVNVQTWKLIFMFGFLSALFLSTTYVFENFLHSWDRNMVKRFHGVFGLDQTCWWRLSWIGFCRRSPIPYSGETKSNTLEKCRYFFEFESNQCDSRCNWKPITWRF